MKEKTNYLNLLRDWKNNKILPLYYFTGDEEFLKEEATKRLIDLLIPPDLRSFNLDVLYGEAVDFSQIINTCVMLPFLSPKRLVIVREVQKLSSSSKDNLLEFLPRLSDPKLAQSICLVFTSPKMDGRIKFYKKLKEICAPIEFHPPYDNQIPAWIRQRFKGYQKEIQPEAQKLLHDCVGNSLSDLANQIEKLAIYVKEKKQITLEDVEEVVGFTRTNNIFQIGNAVGDRDVGKALEILKNLLLYSEKPGSIVFRLTDYLIKLIKVKSKENTMDQKALAVYLGLGNKGSYFLKDYIRHASLFSLEQLEKGLQLLHQTDVDLKRSRLPTKILMELLVYNLCNL